MCSFGRALLAGTVLLLIVPVGVLAHAKLVSSIPAAGAVLTVLPAEIVATFDDPLVDGSSLELVDAAGSTLVTGGVDPSDPLTMRMATPDLASGRYDIRWTARTADDNVERGAIPFRVALIAPTPATPEPAIVVTPLPSPPPTVPSALGPTAAASVVDEPADGSADASGGEALIPIGAAAALIGLGLAWFLRRRSAA